MKKLWIAGGAVVLAAAAAFAWYRATADPGWTTDSPAALEAYQRGRQSQMKFYFADARKDFLAAVAADPDFVVAKIALLDSDGDKEERTRVVASLAQSHSAARM